jgi:hypothetical protein
MTLKISDLNKKSREEIASMLSLRDDLPPSKEAALDRLVTLESPLKRVKSTAILM